MRLQKFGIKCIKRYSFPKLIWCRGIRHILTTFVGEKNNEEQRVLIPRVFFKAQLGEKQVENHCLSTLQINSKLHLCSLFFLLTALLKINYTTSNKWCFAGADGYIYCRLFVINYNSSYNHNNTLTFASVWAMLMICCLVNSFFDTHWQKYELNSIILTIDVVNWKLLSFYVSMISTIEYINIDR